jgi:hypothetical protein
MLSKANLQLSSRWLFYACYRVIGSRPNLPLQATRPASWPGGRAAYPPLGSDVLAAKL